VHESLVLLKNNNNTLPLKANSKILVAGHAAESLANQLGGWSLTWQGTETKASDFPGATKVQTLKKLKAAGIPTVSVFMSGRPMWVNQELNASDAFVAAWLPGTEGQGVADVLFCATPVECGFKGKLSFSWPKDPKQSPLNNIDSLYDPLFKVGYGLKYGETKPLAMLEDKAEINASAIGKVLFKGRGIGSISAVIQEQGEATISASQPPAKTKGDGVSTVVFDRIVQEDAQRIRFNGKGLNSWQLQSDKKLSRP